HHWGVVGNQASARSTAPGPCSDVAALLITPDRRPGHPYLRYNLRNGATLLIPKRGIAHRGGLAIYNPQMASGLAAMSLMWAGIGPGKAVNLRPGPLQELQQLIADSIGKSD